MWAEFAVFGLSSALQNCIETLQRRCRPRSCLPHGASAVAPRRGTRTGRRGQHGEALPSMKLASLRADCWRLGIVVTQGREIRCIAEGVYEIPAYRLFAPMDLREDRAKHLRVDPVEFLVGPTVSAIGVCSSRPWRSRRRPSTASLSTGTSSRWPPPIRSTSCRTISSCADIATLDKWVTACPGLKPEAGLRTRKPCFRRARGVR
jgi:hypothetical protein